MKNKFSPPLVLLALSSLNACVSVVRTETFSLNQEADTNWQLKDTRTLKTDAYTLFASSENYREKMYVFRPIIPSFFVGESYRGGSLDRSRNFEIELSLFPNNPEEIFFSQVKPQKMI